MAKSKKPRPYPNKDTLWSYDMQSIEPTSKEINEVFPEYHPMWVIHSQAKKVNAETFKYLRQYLLNLTQKQCAAYLRVKESRISAWERGKNPVPFMAFETLRLLSQSIQFNLSSQAWQGWFINNEGRLVSPDRGKLSFTPHELSFIREVHQAKAMYEAENKQLKALVEPLKAEIADLRAATGRDGVLDELKAIEHSLTLLSQRISNNKVVDISSRTKPNQPNVEVKVA